MTDARPPDGQHDAAEGPGRTTPGATPAADEIDPGHALAREQARTRAAATDARRAEREALETGRRLRKVTGQLEVERGRVAALRRRRALRIADELARGIRTAQAAAARLRSRARGTRPSALIVHPVRQAHPDADPRGLAGRYRATIRASLRGPDGPDGPLRVTLIEPRGEPGVTGAGLRSVADALRARGAHVIRQPMPTETRPLDPGTDVVVIGDSGVDPLTLPTGPIRVAWAADAGASGDLDRSEWDITLPAEADAGRALLEGLERWLQATRIGIRAPTGSTATADAWGDTYFARDLRTALRAAGYPTRIHFYDAWDEPAVGHDDVVIDLVGLYQPVTRPGAVRVLWQISHPEFASGELYSHYDLVYVASDRFATLIAEETQLPVRPLHQATDPERFRPGLPGPANELLVVANWRPHRPIVSDVLPIGHRLAIFGRGWTPEIVGPGPALGEPISNDELGGYYAGAAILLNDHAPGMRREGFLSNRLYDAAACGTLVISDPVDGLDAEFDGGVLSYRDRAGLHALIDRYLADPAARAETADRARRAVLERHTFAHRAATLIAAIEPRVAAIRERSA